MDTDEDRNLRRSGIAGAIGLAAAAAWGFYIFAGIAISGYTLGRNATADLLAVLPPLAAGALLSYGAITALRDVRRQDWLVRLIAIVLFATEGALGVCLIGYAAWAGPRVARGHAARAVAPEPVVRTELVRQTPQVTPPR